MTSKEKLILVLGGHTVGKDGLFSRSNGHVFESCYLKKKNSRHALKFVSASSVHLLLGTRAIT